MAEDEIHNEKEEFSGKSASQLTRELLRLILVLIWRFLVWLFKRVLKGILWCMQAIEDGILRLNDWWHDTNTQEKVAKIKAALIKGINIAGDGCVKAVEVAGHGLKIAAKATGKGVAIGAKATGRGIVIGAKATWHGIVHLGPTLKRLGRLVVQGYRATIAGLRRWRRGMKLSRIRRRRAYEEFQRRGGMKGWMVNTSRNIRDDIQKFMEEDQQEAAPDAVTEDDIIEEALEEGANDGKKPMKFGKSFMSHAKNFMDVE